MQLVIIGFKKRWVKLPTITDAKKILNKELFYALRKDFRRLMTIFKLKARLEQFVFFRHQYIFCKKQELI